MPETDFPCCDPKPATKAPEWYRDRVRQAINEYTLNMSEAAQCRRLANRHPGTRIVHALAVLADEHRTLAHDAVLEAAEAVKQERGL